MTEISHSGCKLLLGRRMFVATALSIVAKFIFMSCVILITNLSITHPLSWINDTWSMITRWRMWCYFIVLAAVILLQGLICSKDYLTPPLYRKSRFDAARAMFTPHNFVVGSLHVAIGVILVWSHLSLENGKYGALTERCKTGHGLCLVEEYYFLITGGLWMGMYFFVKTNFNAVRYFDFSPIPQSKFVRIKRGIGAMSATAMTDAVWPSLYFLVLYYALRSYLKGVIVCALSLNAEDEAPDGFAGLFDPFLIFRTWLYATLFGLTMNTMHLLFQACLTEWIPFEISRESVFDEGNSSVVLYEALEMEKIPIVRHLGYLDLATLAQKDKARRSQLFALSQPGGHPYNWNCVVEKCLALLTKFTEDMDEASSTTRDKAQTSTKPSEDDSQKTHAYSMRNLMDARTTIPKCEEETRKPEVSMVVEYLMNFRDHVACYLLSKPLVFYFFGRQSESKIRHVLTNGQTVVWAADAISSLAVVSLTEDPYGIVQKDLPAIIENLLSLKQALDKLQKTNILVRKPQNDDKTVRMILTSLRMAVKRSIYRIVSSFGDYIDDIAIHKTVKHQLENFLVYRE